MILWVSGFWLGVGMVLIFRRTWRRMKIWPREMTWSAAHFSACWLLLSASIATATSCCPRPSRPISPRRCPPVFHITTLGPTPPPPLLSSLYALDLVSRIPMGRDHLSHPPRSEGSRRGGAGDGGILLKLGLFGSACFLENRSQRWSRGLYAVVNAHLLFDQRGSLYRYADVDLPKFPVRF